MAGSTARVIAVANQKGGVGKSTTAVSLGASLAELGKRVLVVDLDPQGNASTGLGIRHEARDVTVYDVLAAEAAIEGAIVQTPVENLYAIPSTIDLAGAEIELVSQFSRELRLRKALEPLKAGADAFDFILLDCPPSLGLLTVNALAAAEELIVPIQCEYYALEGLGQLLRNVRLVQQNVNPNLRLTGIVMTMYDPRTKLSEQVVEEVRRHFGDRVYNTIIPRTVRLSEAPGFGQPITVYDPRSRGAQCYRELALEVVDKLPAAEPLPSMDDVPTMVIPPPESAAEPPLVTPARAPRPLVREEPDASPSIDQLDAAPLAPPQAQVEPETAPAREPPPPAEPHDAQTNGHASVDTIASSQVAGAAQEPTMMSPETPEVDTVSDDSGNLPGGDLPPDRPRGGELEAPPPPASSRERALEPPRPPEGIDLPTEPSTETPTVAAPRHEDGRVILVDDEPVIEEARPMPEPEEEVDSSRKRRWGLFRRGGER